MSMNAPQILAKMAESALTARETTFANVHLVGMVERAQKKQRIAYKGSA
jgi:hypothetical protein